MSNWMNAEPEKTDGKLDITTITSTYHLKSAFYKLIEEEARSGKRKNELSTLKARQLRYYCDTYDEMLDQIVQFVDVVGTRPQLDLSETCKGIGEY